jgi:hypothetical protein
VLRARKRQVVGARAVARSATEVTKITGKILTFSFGALRVLVVTESIQALFLGALGGVGG